MLSLCVLVGSSAAFQWTGGDASYSLVTALKWTSLVSYAPDDTALYPQRSSAAALSRMRVTAKAAPCDWLDAELAYEQRLRLESSGAGAAGGSGVFPAEIDAPYRIWQLDAAVMELDSGAYRHEIDRAALTLRWRRVDVTLGRQAVGWGRGVMFSAVDVFAPFTPLESDREWRRGIDAARARVPLGTHTSGDMVAARGESPKESALACRIQGYVGDIDGELIIGKRREDYLFAASVSTPVLDAEVHAEGALFKTPDAMPDGGLFGTDNLVAKAVIGASRSFDWGAGVYGTAECLYSGFGVAHIHDLEEQLEDEVFVRRYLRGDSQTLSRHAVAVQLTYGLGNAAPVNLSWIMSPTDGSGVVIAGLTWVFSDNLTLVANGYLPHGARPRWGSLRSEYGGTPMSALVGVRFYC